MKGNECPDMVQALKPSASHEVDEAVVLREFELKFPRERVTRLVRAVLA